MADPTMKVEVELPESLKKLGENLEAIRASIAKLEGSPPESGALSPELTILKADMAKAETELAKALGELQEQVTARTKELEESRAEVVKIRLARRRETFIKRVQQLSHLPGAPADDFAEILEKAEAGMSPKQFEKLNTLLSSWDAIIAKSAVFQEIGRSDIQAFAGAQGKLHGLALDRASKDKITYEKAYSLVMDENPTLYKQYVAEKKES